MKYSKIFVFTFLTLLSAPLFGQTKQWTLQECLDYALKNNIQLKQQALSTKSSKEDVLQSKSALFPSVSFNTSQTLNYKPYSKYTKIEDGNAVEIDNAFSYNGSYSISARWTVWNGGRNYNTIKQNELKEKQNEYSEQEVANNIQEKITMLFVQVLYENEAIKVSEETLKSSQMQLERAKAMVEIGHLAKVDQVQLEAQVAQDELSVVNCKSQLESFKLQLKQLLEIHDDEAFEIATPNVSDDKVLTAIPDKASVYNTALNNRPEIKSKQLGIENSELSVKSARAGYMPTVSLNAGVSSMNSSPSDDSFGQQLKKGLGASVGLSISVPIFDNFDTRTSIRKAKYNQETAQLQLQDAEKTLYSSIENYYLDASTNQKKYIYAKKNVESMQESYDLVSEQFRLGLKNIVELTTGKNNLLQAEQNLLETKYTTLYNQAMLRFYQGETINL